MQHDEVIWQVINQNFCSYKVKTETQNFCRSRYNITGLCNRSSCPLANSRYCTVLEQGGKCFLYIKTIERAHSPKNLWEKIKLSANYAEALKQIDQHLAYWPNFLIHKAKQRLTKIHQMLIRMRKLKLKVRPKIVGVPKKVERRERNREVKALKAARIEEKIKNELIQRLQQGVYGDEYKDIVNIHQAAYEKSLKALGAKEDEEGELATLSEEEEEELDAEEREQRRKERKAKGEDDSDDEFLEAYEEEEEEEEEKELEQEDDDGEEVELVEGDFESEDDIEDVDNGFDFEPHNVFEGADEEDEEDEEMELKSSSSSKASSRKNSNASMKDEALSSSSSSSASKAKSKRKRTDDFDSTLLSLASSAASASKPSSMKKSKTASLSSASKSSKKGKNRGRIEMEYEEEGEALQERH